MNKKMERSSCYRKKKSIVVLLKLIMVDSDYSNNFTWAALEEQPFMDGYGGGAWVCGATRGWGFPEEAGATCTSCPPCVVDRFQTQLNARDGGLMCSTSEFDGKSNGYENNWPYQFVGNIGRPMGPEVPLFQELYNVRRYLPQDIPIQTPYNPWML